jgi:hypothetical protein
MALYNTQWRKVFFFINRFGGCGKTYLYQTIFYAIWAQGNIILCIASTGLTCLLLPGGQTAHSMFKIPIDTLNDKSVCNIAKESLWAKLVRMTVAVIYDECLMTHQHCFEALDQTFQDLHNSLILFGDDFQQILPVVLQGLFADIVDACLCMSYLWNDIIILKLCTNMWLQHSPKDTNSLDGC